MPAGSGASARAARARRADAGELQHRKLAREHRDQPARDLADGLRGRVVGVGDDERHAGVGLLAQRHRERHLAEQRHVELVGEQLAAALAEDREALAGRA